MYVFMSLSLRRLIVCAKDTHKHLCLGGTGSLMTAMVETTSVFLQLAINRFHLLRVPPSIHLPLLCKLKLTSAIRSVEIAKRMGFKSKFGCCC